MNVYICYRCLTYQTEKDMIPMKNPKGGKRNTQEIFRKCKKKNATLELF